MTAQINPPPTIIPGLAQQAAITTLAGFSLQDATPTILSWTAPNDGKPHPVLIFATLHVTSSTTGGEVDLDFTTPDGTSTAQEIFSGTQSSGVPWANTEVTVMCEPGSTVSIKQSTAVTLGAAAFWGQIWGL